MQNLFVNFEYPDPVYGDLSFTANSDDQNETLEKSVQKLQVSNEMLRENLECMKKEYSELIKSFDLVKAELERDILELKSEKENQRMELHVAHNEVETVGNENENEQHRVLSTGLSHQINFHMKDRHQGLNFDIRKNSIKDLQEEHANDSFFVDEIEEIDRCRKTLSEVLDRIKRRNKIQDYSKLIHGKSMTQSMKFTEMSPIIKPVSEIASIALEKLQTISIAFLENSLKATMLITCYAARNTFVALVIFIVIIIILSTSPKLSSD